MDKVPKPSISDSFAPKSRTVSYTVMRILDTQVDSRSTYTLISLPRCSLWLFQLLLLTEDVKFYRIWTYLHLYIKIRTVPDEVITLSEEGLGDSASVHSLGRVGRFSHQVEPTHNARVRPSACRQRPVRLTEQNELN
jgi:hypothetical protein